MDVLRLTSFIASLDVGHFGIPTSPLQCYILISYAFFFNLNVILALTDHFKILIQSSLNKKLTELTWSI